MYETFEHTADLGLRVRAPNLDTLFAEAAEALFAAIFEDLSAVEPRESLAVRVAGKDQAPDQVANVATLPGIQVASLAMPDIHWGYGFCIGGVCATDPDEGGVISPGGVGYDINCGVRLVRSNLFYREVKPHLRALVEELFRQVPTGAGRSGRYSFRDKELRQLLSEGARYVVGRGFGTARDVEF